MDNKFYKIFLAIVITYFLCINGCVLGHTEEYTSKEIEVAKVICAEAVGEGKIGMLGVANVINNRMKLKKKSAYEIVTESKQFSGYTAKNKEKLFEQDSQYALFLASNIEKLKDVTNGGLFFKRPEEKKKAWHKTLCCVIGNHQFWR